MFEAAAQFIIPAIIGGLAGFAASWLNWDIEKRRAKLQRRQAMVDIWRSQLLSSFDDGAHKITGSGHHFTTLPAYESLRPHLSAKFLDQVEFKGGVLSLQINPDPAWPKRQLSEERSRVEKAWGLI